jgi:hypothetical protein
MKTDETDTPPKTGKNEDNDIVEDIVQNKCTL